MKLNLKTIIAAAAFTVALSVAFTVSAQEKVDPKYVDLCQIDSITHAGITRQYALYQPKDANGNVKKNIPLVIWNHGGGEYNVPIRQSLLANRGVVAWPEEGFECAVLMLQVANPNYSYMAALDEQKIELIDRNNAVQAEIVRRLIASGDVDPSRVYVTGASSGGGATMRFVMQFPELVRAAIPCCAMDPIVLITKNTEDNYETILTKLEAAFRGYVYTWSEGKQAMVKKPLNTQAFLDVPMYFVHAIEDLTVSVNTSKAYFEVMQKMGDTNNKITLWTNEELIADGIAVDKIKWLTHFSWEKLLKHHEPGSPMHWLFEQK